MKRKASSRSDETSLPSMKPCKQEEEVTDTKRSRSRNKKYMQVLQDVDSDDHNDSEGICF